jgi:hypothetical protein
VSLLTISVLAISAPLAVAQSNINTITVGTGQQVEETLTFCVIPSPSGIQGSTVDMEAYPTGSASSWVMFANGAPSHVFESVPYGSCVDAVYYINVPGDAMLGEYTLSWGYTCEDDLGYTCNVMVPAEFTVVVASNMFKVTFKATVPSTVIIDGVGSTTPVTVERPGGTVIHYTWAETTTYNGVTYDLLSSSSGSMHVYFDMSIYAAYMPSGEATGPPSQGSCPNGYTQGGLASSPICYPPSLEVTKSGTVSTVDLSGGPAYKFVANDVGLTDPYSMLGVGDEGMAWEIGPATEVAWVPVGVSSDGSWSSYDRTSGFWDVIDGYWYALTGTTSNPPQSVLVTEAAIDHLVSLEKQSLITIWDYSKVTLLEVTSGVLHFQHTSTNNDQAASPCLATPDISGCPTGSEYTVSVGQNGTTVRVLSGKFTLSDFATNSTMVLGSGESVFVPRGGVQAPIQKPFDPSSVNMWWSGLVSHVSNSTSTASASEASTTSTSETSTLASVTSTTSNPPGNTSPLSELLPAGSDEMALLETLVVFIVIVGIAVGLRSRQRRQAIPQQAQPARCPKCGAPVGSQSFCDNCGTKL